MPYAVYLHENMVNGKKYVGITSLPVEKRWKGGSHYENNSHFRSAIEKYGWDKFSHKIVFSNLTREEAINAEMSLIRDMDLMNPSKGYNKTSGGEHPRVSEETRIKLREIRLGDRNGFYGRNHTLESRKMMSERRKGLTSGERHPMYGREHTKEAMEKIRSSNTWYNESMRERNESLKKPVLMLLRDGTLVRKFSCVLEAVNYLNGLGNKSTKPDIQRVCYGKRQTAYGYVWKYEKEVNQNV